MKKTLWLLAASLCFPAVAARSASIQIDAVAVDQTAGQLYIDGANLIQLGFVPIVTLDGQTLSVCSSCYSDTSITAALPPGLQLGDYALRIFTAKTDLIEYGLTIGAGAVGLQGGQEEKGEKEDAGPCEVESHCLYVPNIPRMNFPS